MTTTSIQRTPRTSPMLAERSLSLTMLRWSSERIPITKQLIKDMLCWPDLYDLESAHLRAAEEALERAESELSQVTSGKA